MINTKLNNNQIFIKTEKTTNRSGIAISRKTLYTKIPELKN